MRRPIARAATITGDTATHADYGVGPATDYALAPGDAVVAPFDMSITAYRSGTGGWSLLGVGPAVVNFQHLVESSRRTGPVSDGTVIARIAGVNDSPGSSWTGPHLHTWVDAGVRMSFEEYIASLGFTAAALGQIASPTLVGFAGGSGKPLPDDNTPAGTPVALLEEEIMRPQFWRWTEGKIENSLFLIVYPVGDTLVGVEFDGRKGLGPVQAFAVQQQDAAGHPYGEVPIFGDDYKAIRSKVTLLTPPAADLK